MSPPPTDGGGGPPTRREPATTTTPNAASHGAPECAQGIAPEVADDDAAIRRVLNADDDTLAVVLRADSAVRRGLRSRPTDGRLDCARTLLAAARVERRRRRSAGDVLAEILDAVEGSR